MASFKRKKISVQTTVGERLRSTRRKKKINLEQAEEETKIRLKYLQAIESDNFKNLPSRVYVLGFIRRYSEYLGLNADEMVEEFKASYGQNTKISTFSWHNASFGNKISITPKLLITGLAVILVLGVILYLGISIAKFSKPPTIDIVAPSGSPVAQKNLVIEGKTTETASVEINNQAVNVDDNGNFSQKVELTPGVNIFQISSKNRIGKESQKVVKVLYEVPGAVAATPAP